jgi:hypothetical protein
MFSMGDKEQPRRALLICEHGIVWEDLCIPATYISDVVLSSVVSQRTGYERLTLSVLDRNGKSTELAKGREIWSSELSKIQELAREYVLKGRHAILDPEALPSLDFSKKPET